MRRLTVVLRFPVAAFAALAAFVALGDKSGNGGPEAANVAPYRLYVDAMHTAESFKAPAASKGNAGDAASVALGRSYMISRLARPGRKFSCVDSPSAATHRLSMVVSFLRSRENSFSGQTYGHSTRTTTWSLDVIVALKKESDVLLSKTVTGTYEERRPISEAQFDNNIFHNLMVAAIEMAAENIVDYFEDEGSAPEAGDVPPATGGSPVAPVAGGGVRPDAPVASGPSDARLPLAILKPEAQAGVSDQEAMTLWDLLESSVRGGAFRIVSRSDIGRMQEEIGFTTSSDLVNLASRDRARIGKIKTVSKLLATTVGKIGETYTLALKVFDASTAEIETDRSRTLTARSIDAFLPLLPALLAEALVAQPSGTVLVSAVAPMSMPQAVARAFDMELAQAFAAAGVAIKGGTEGHVRIVPSIAAYAVRVVQDGDGFVYRGSISGSIRVEGADVAPVAFAIEDVELGREQGAAPSWLTQQYGKKLVAMALKAETVRNWLPAVTNLK